MAIDPIKFDKFKFRKKLIKYTEQAFNILPKLDKPNILDIGCGSGEPTILLARLTNGHITGIDIDKEALERFRTKVAENKLSDRITILECSMFDIPFPAGSFDIIWSEGSIFVAGFEKGLRSWRELLKPKGFLMVHDESIGFNRKLNSITDSGYDLLGHFKLDEKVWWTEYFEPLEEYINEKSKQYANDPSISAEIAKQRAEVDMVKSNPSRHTSVYFIMQKN
jgi:SAM-dependent methyltransferase